MKFNHYPFSSIGSSLQVDSCAKKRTCVAPEKSGRGLGRGEILENQRPNGQRCSQLYQCSATHARTQKRLHSHNRKKRDYINTSSANTVRNSWNKYCRKTTFFHQLYRSILPVRDQLSKENDFFPILVRA